MKNPIWLLLVSAVVSAFVGFFVNPALYIVAGAIGLVIALGWGWPSVTTRWIDCHLRFERSRCREGETVVAKLTVRNRGWLPAWGLTLSRGFVSELASHSDGAEQPLAALGRVPARRTASFTWQYRPSRRGVYPIETPVLETRFPFGLSTATVEISVNGSLIVWPSVVGLQSTPESLTLSGREDRLSDRRAGDFGDVLGTRSFRHGDSLRRIHWAQSARLDRLIVCERQAACTCSVTLRPDLRSLSHSGDSSSLERTLKITASLVRHFHRSGVGCVLVLNQETISVPPGQQQAYRIAMDALAKVPERGWKEAPVLRSRSESEILITTDQAHQTGPARTIVLETGSGDCAACHAERVWCRVPLGSCVEDFPRLWRSACHAA